MKSIFKFLPAFLILAVMTTIVAARPAQGQTLTTLYSFAGSPDGAVSFGGLLRDPDGNLYGTTLLGGTGGQCSPYIGCGTIFELDARGRETVLYSFSGGADGSLPYAGLIRDDAGNLYGTTGGGGANQFGTIFELDTSHHETVLYSFTGGADGGNPQGGLIRDAEGNFYGTTGYSYDVNECQMQGCGSVFKLDSAGNLTVLYQFTGYSDGGNPAGNLVRDSQGNLYGTNVTGGDSYQCFGGGCGVVFKIDPAGHETTLHIFCLAKDCPDGAIPVGGLILDAQGNLYGATSTGGMGCPDGGIGCGVVFKIDRTGTETVLHTFAGGASDGAGPNSLIRDAQGNLYGTAYGGGNSLCRQNYGCGIIFKLDPNNKETILYTFTGGAGGGNPNAALISDGHGNGYSTTAAGGNSCSTIEGQPPAGCGTAFKISSK